MKPGRLDKRLNSLDSEMSEASTLVSSGSDDGRRHRITHQPIRSHASDTEVDSSMVCLCKLNSLLTALARRHDDMMYLVLGIQKLK